MDKFKFSSHRVLKAEFSSNFEKNNSVSFPVQIDGGILIPQDSSDNDTVSVKLDLTLGNKNNDFILTMETISVFNILDCNTQVSSTDANNYCIPVALQNLRNTIKKVTTAFGIPVVDLPPFSEESNISKEQSI